MITFLGGIAIALWFGIAFIIGKEVEALQYGILQYIFIDLIFALLVQLQFIFSVHKIKQVYI
ncbi:hypothetical protein [Helicobacter didelphidarum]|uniref:hypothetical protein n=1 Tax=Helicobacter didelphidarum TaxID=2040648 RepID=UPI0011C02DC0|nr:hypothetical protein [Helicobacter didelphidarum]